MVMGGATPPTCSITLEAVLLGGGGELSCGSGSHQLRGFGGRGGQRGEPWRQQWVVTGGKATVGTTTTQ